MIALVDRSIAYQFKIKSDSKIHVVVFDVSDVGMDINCSCSGGNKGRPCWHARYILAGRTRRLISGSELHTELLKKLAGSEWGIEIVNQAKQEFLRVESSCRRCGSQNVIFLRHSLFGKFVSLFKPNSHHHFCKSCKWSW